MIKRIFHSLLLIMLTVCVSYGQQAQRKNNNWFNMDPDADRFAGVSSDKAYEKLLQSMVPDTVIVAVLDGGTDPLHPDLAQNIWVNMDEIPGNGTDDDNNGFADDVNGWNFLGGKAGNVNHENLEITRQYRKYLDAKASGKTITPEMKYAAKAYPKEKKDTERIMAMLNMVNEDLTGIESIAGKDSVKVSHVETYTPKNKSFGRIRKLMIYEMRNGTSYYSLKDQLIGAKSIYQNIIDYNLNLAFNGRGVIGDDPENYNDRNYGNNDVKGDDAAHGTHVAGIIAAVRNNDTGMNGIASAVKIMVLRVVPNGDEYDKDIANGIRYAVDNGAKIINMSFGKDLSPGKKYIDEAMAYAASKDVLIVHASGNDGKNIDKDKNRNYPYPFFLGTDNRIPGWIEVGANSASGEAGRFSNYGKKTVDLFAPGVAIYSTLPDSSYGTENGTSMAAPMVSGVAALLRSYFPGLTAEQVRNILVATVTKVPFDTVRPGTQKKKTGYNELCVTGGIVNAFKAVEMAKGISK